MSEAPVRLRPRPLGPASSGGRLARLAEAGRALFGFDPHRGTTGPGALLAVLALVAGTTLSLLRQPGVGALDTVWAEDGSIFLSDALRESSWEALGSAYAGYYHLVPRLLAEIATLFPLSWAAEVLAVEAALITAALALAVYVASRAHLDSTVLRLLVSAPVVLLPLAQEELPNSIANLHWPALYATFWMLLWNPVGRGRQAVAALVVGLSAASDLLCVIFLPLVLLRVLAVRGWRGRWVPAAFAAGLALQVVAKLFGESSRALTPDPNPVWAGAAYVLRAVPLALVGERWLGPDVNGGIRYLALVAVAWLIVLAAVVLALRRLIRAGWALAVVAAAHSVGLYLLSTMLSGLVVPRYAAAPALLLLAALAALLVPAAAGRRRAGVLPLAGFGVLVLVVAVVNLRVDNPRADGPSWSDSVRQGRSECAARADAVAVLPISPSGWTAPVPCGAGLR